MKLAVLIVAWLVVAGMLFVLCRRGWRKYRATGSLFRERRDAPRFDVKRLWLFWLTGAVLGTGGAFCMQLYFRIGLPLLAVGLVLHGICLLVIRWRNSWLGPLPPGGGGR
jgi:hypothetical protein